MKSNWLWMMQQHEVNLLFNVTINDISVIYVTAHKCAGGLNKKCDERSGSQLHRRFVGFFNVPVLAPTRDHPFYTVIPTHRPILSPFTITLCGWCNFNSSKTLFPQKIHNLLILCLTIYLLPVFKISSEWMQYYLFYHVLYSQTHTKAR